MGAWLRSLERLLVTVAAVCGFWGGLTLGEQAYYRSAARGLAATTRVRVAAAPVAAVPPVTSPAVAVDDEERAPAVVVSAPPRPASLIGELEVPHLRLATAILEGADRVSLRRGAGHLPGTSLPGGSGNVALAGHRDTVFRRLGELQRGDRIRITTTAGIFDYRVSQTLRVTPTDTWVLEPGAAALTLITCYPFEWIGAAPERWVVQANPIE